MKRKPADYLQFKIRMREHLRARLERQAANHQVSINAEIVNRLEASFAKEDALGGAEHYRTALLMASAFATGAGNHEQGSATAYIAGMGSVLGALMAGVRLEDRELAAAYLKGVFLTAIANKESDDAR